MTTFGCQTVKAPWLFALGPFLFPVSFYEFNRLAFLAFLFLAPAHSYANTPFFELSVVTFFTVPFFLLMDFVLSGSPSFHLGHVSTSLAVRCTNAQKDSGSNLFFDPASVLGIDCFHLFLSESFH